MFRDSLFQGYGVHGDDSGIGVSQDISGHLEWAKIQRGLSKGKRKDTGFKPYCNIPDSVALDILTKHKLNLHDPNIEQSDLNKIKRIIKLEYPHLMYY
jgi:hypothetical protein